jgi:hypothetical protein
MKSPEVNRKTLLLLAGVVWTGVGLALCALAIYWLSVTPGNWILPLFTGIIVGMLVYYFGFLRLVKKNTDRIYTQAPGKNKVCLFAFQSWSSYVIIIVMMAVGYILRHFVVSRLYLVPIYLAIGLGLFLASFHYYSAAK